MCYLKFNNIEDYRYLEQDVQEWQKYLSITFFQKLQHLKVKYLPSNGVCMLIENSHGNIKEISIWDRLEEKDPLCTKKLFKAIAKNCSKIERLKVEIQLENLSGIKEIFLNCERLNKLSLLLKSNVGIICDELLEILINYSP